MKTRDLLSLVLSNLRRMKARVAMTAIGVVIGTAAVVVLMSLGAGLQKLTTQNLYGMGGLDELMVRNDMYYEPESKGGTDERARGPRPVLNKAMLEEIQQIEGVQAVMPVLEVQMQGPLKWGRQEGWGQLYGVDVSTLSQFATLDRGQLDMYRGQVVLGASVPENFVPWEERERSKTPIPTPDLLEQTLDLTRYSFQEGDAAPTMATVGRLQVVGILARRGYVYDYSIFLPIKEALRLNQQMASGSPQPNPEKVGYNQVMVKAVSARQAPAVEQAITDKGFNVQSDRQMLEQINRFFMIVQVVLGGIGAIALLVAAFGIANTMVMAIYERTREIGLMKAIGATNQDVMSVFLAEAGGIGLLGGVGGVLLALLLNILINTAGQSLLQQSGGGLGPPGGTTTPSELTYTPAWLMVFAIGFATLVGIASGVYPAIRAAALSPIKALKYE